MERDSPLSSIGLSSKRISELNKENMKDVKAALLDMLSFCSVTTTTEQIGSLLDELAGGTKSKHRNTVAKYIVDGKMARANLTAALRYLKELSDNDLDVAKFEKECGLGVVVSNDEIKAAITEICSSNETLLKDGWNSQGKIMPLLKKHEKLMWADGKSVKDSLDEEFARRFGERSNTGKAKKPAENQEQATQTKKSDKTEPKKLEELDPSKYREIRIAQIENLKSQGIDPYPHKFEKTISLEEYRAKYDYLTKDQEVKDQPQRIVGRIVNRRDQSEKLIFLVIQEGAHRVQVLANWSQYEDKAKWDLILTVLRVGDIIGAIGFPCRSKTNELSLTPEEIILLAPCLHMIPHKLQDMETRYRQRHLDMLVHGDVIKTFQIRSKIIAFIRNFFNQRGFLEVETPTMGVLAGGATAKPFITHHNDLGVDLFMRVAPELYLKQLIIGGMHKVYEIGKNYRNEDIDTTHNPEFTAIETYEAFADYNDLMIMTEELLSSLVFHLYGKYQVELHPHGRDNPEGVFTIDFSPPFDRFPMIPTLETKLNVKFPEDLTTEDTRKWLIEICKTHEAECSEPLTNYRLLDALVGKFIEKDIINKPGFIIDHPQLMSPLAKYHRKYPGLTERFELFVAKKELANAYTELNNPSVQRSLFQTQSVQNAQDDEAQPIDEGYCTAMEYGLPPTGGWGMGIDRLCMMLSDNYNIKEVLLFPAMKPLPEQIAAQKVVLSKLRKNQNK